MYPYRSYWLTQNANPLVIGGLVILLHIISPRVVWSQLYSVQNYGISEGLPNPTITGLTEDSLGYLWIGTAGGGISRFDGREFKNFDESNGLVYNTVTCLTLDRSGMLWIGTGRGLSRFDGKTFKNFLLKEPYALLQAYIVTMAVVADTLFFSTSRGQLGKIYRDSLFYDPALPEVSGLLSSGTDELFMLYPTGKLIRKQKETSLEYTLPRGLQQVNRITLVNVRGTLVLSGYSKLLKLNADGTVKPMHDLPERVLEAYDAHQDITWSSDNKGLQSTGNGIRFTHQESIPQVAALSRSFIDSEGNSWFGTFGNGLFKVSQNDFVKMLPGDFVRSIFRDKQGTLWVGTIGSGIKRIDYSGTTAIPFYSAGQSIVRDMVEDVSSGNLVLATHAGLLTLNRSTNAYTIKGRAQGLASDSLYCLEFDHRGDLWVGTLGKGLMRFGPDGYKHYSWQDSLYNDYIFSLQSWKEKLFIGTSRGLNVFTDNRIEKITIPGFRERMIYSLCRLDEHHLLIASLGKGVAIMNVDSATFDFITTRQGLVSDNVHFVNASGNYIWIGTDRGINRVKLNNLHQVTEVLLFNRKNGFYGVETSVNASLAEDSAFYAGSNDGLYRFSNTARPRPHAHFALHLTGIRLFREDSLPVRSRMNNSFMLPRHPVLRHDQNHLTFHINRVNKSNPESTVYRYKLEGVEEEWSPASEINEITYNNLPGGTYTLRVEATDYTGHWGNDVLTYPFIILQPFYKRPVFIVAAVLTLLLLLFIFFHLQVRRRIARVVFVEKIKLAEQEKLRKEIARDFHDEMGNHLAKIINYIAMLRLKGGLSEEEVYTRVEQSAKHLNSGTKDFIWAIDPQNNELTNLFLYVKDFGEKLFQESGINFRAFNSIEEGIRLPFGVARELILIFKEAMTNAYKHSKARNVAFSLRQDHDAFELFLEDDGVGFALENNSKNGLSNIRVRAEKIHSTLTVESLPGKTKILVRFTAGDIPSHGP
jgi:signal transduction histidine kinase/ligand-binding sensor domain-containing protein